VRSFILGFVAVVALLALVLLPASPVDAGPTKETMNKVFEHLTVLLPMAVDGAPYSSRIHSKDVEGALKGLVDGTKSLRIHGSDEDPAYRHLSRTLARDAVQARQLYASGRTDASRQRVLRITQVCAACHARRPSQANKSFSDRLMAVMEPEKMALEDLARLQQAVRQDEQALQSYEKLFLQNRMERVWSVGDYLTVAVRVTGQPERAVPTLRALIDADDVPDWFRGQLKGWLGDLELLASRPNLDDPLAQGRALVAQSRGELDLPTDRRGLVLLLAAARHLDALVLEEEPGPRTAEAYYLLGLIGDHVGSPSRLSQSEAFLEAAVRTAPSSPFAHRALARLEWMVAAEYGTLRADKLPPGVRVDLNELRSLVNR
jgi:hypothetical protein